MRKFELYKTIQLVLLLVLAAVAVVLLLRGEKQIREIPGGGALVFVLLALIASSLVFLFLDLGTYLEMRRENAELDQALFTDTLTGVANHRSCDAYVAKFRHEALPDSMGCAVFRLDNLQQIAGMDGHAAGNAALCAFCDILVEAARRQDPDCFIGRRSEESFLVVYGVCSDDMLDEVRKEITLKTQERAAAGDKSPVPPLNQDRYRLRSLHRPLAEMRPVIPRTPESWRRVLGDLAAAAGFFTTH